MATDKERLDKLKEKRKKLWKEYKNEKESNEWAWSQYGSELAGDLCYEEDKLFNKIQKIDEQIKLLQRTPLQKLKDEMKELETKRKEVELNLDSAQNEVYEYEEEIKQIEKKIKSLDKKILKHKSGKKK